LKTWFHLLPNMITLARLFAVPVVVWAIATGEAGIAFGLFIAAGVSDAVDGFLAKRFHLETELGAYLDPIADKALLVSIYVSLAIAGHLPVWLTTLVVARDLLIVGAVMLAVVLGRPVRVRPIPVSKANTLLQIVLAAVVLAAGAFDLDVSAVSLVLMIAVAGLTVASAAAYLVEWMAHMTSGPPPPPGAGQEGVDRP
jgi:cardiolipin synthase